VLVRGDPSRLHQALVNLVGNALKYSPKDSVVEVTVQRAPGAAEVSITDHGPGISRMDQAALFEPFRRVAGAERVGPGAPPRQSSRARSERAREGLAFSRVVHSDREDWRPIVATMQGMVRRLLRPRAPAASAR